MTAVAITTTNTSWQSYTLPSGFGSSNTLQTLGPGGSGSARASTSAGGRGGGGGSYAIRNNIDIPANALTYYQLGAGGSAIDCWFGFRNGIYNSGFPSGSGWGTNNVTATYAQTDRLGGSHAVKITDSGNNNGYYGLYQSGTLTRPASHALKVAACVEVQRISSAVPAVQLALSISSGYICWATVNFATGLVGGSDAYNNGTLGWSSIDQATVTDLGSGWYRIFIQGTILATDTGTNVVTYFYAMNADGSEWQAGTGTEAMYYAEFPVLVFGDYQPNYYENTSTSTPSYWALGRYGTNATTSTAGAGQTGSQGDTTYQGGNGAANSTSSGGGGGGAAGPGGNGGNASTTTGGSADNGTVSGATANNNGNSGTEFDATHGCGSGAGGRTGGANGFTGGSYGGGGSGAGTTTGGTGGVGGQAFIWLTYASQTVKAIGSAISQSSHNIEQAGKLLSSSLSSLANAVAGTSGGSVSLRSISTVTYGTHTNTSFDKPTGTTSGDYLLLVMFGESDGTGTMLSITGPSGWSTGSTNPFDQYTDGGNNTGSMNIFWTVAGGSEPSSYSTTHVASPTEGILYCFEGVNPSWTPVLSVDNLFGSNTATAESVSVTIANSIVVCFGFAWNAANGFVPPSGYTVDWDGGTVVYSSSKLYISTGDTGTQDTSIPNNGNGVWSSSQLVLAPSSGGGSTTNKTVGIPSSWAIAKLTSISHSIGMSIAEFVSNFKNISKLINAINASSAVNVKSANKSLRSSVGMSSRDIENINNFIKVATTESCKSSAQVAKSFKIASSESIKSLRSGGKSILIAASEAIGLQRLKAILRTISLSDNQSIGFARGKFAFRSFSVAEAQTLSHVRSTAKPLTIVTAQAFSVLQSLTKNLSSVIAQAIHSIEGLAKLVALAIVNPLDLHVSRSTGLVREMAQSSTASRISGIRHFVRLSQLQTLSARAQYAFVRSYGVIENQAINLYKGISHTIKLSQALAISIPRNMIKFMGLATPGTVGAVVSKAKLFSLDISQGQVSEMLRTLGHYLSIIEAQLVNIRRICSKYANVSGNGTIGIGRGISKYLRHGIVNIAGSKINKAYLKQYGIVEETISRTASSIGRFCYAFQEQTTGLFKSVPKSSEVIQSSSASLRAFLSKAISVTQEYASKLINGSGLSLSIASTSSINFIRALSIGFSGFIGQSIGEFLRYIPEGGFKIVANIAQTSIAHASTGFGLFKVIRTFQSQSVSAWFAGVFDNLCITAFLIGRSTAAILHGMHRNEHDA